MDLRKNNKIYFFFSKKKSLLLSREELLGQRAGVRQCGHGAEMLAVKELVFAVLPEQLEPHVDGLNTGRGSVGDLPVGVADEIAVGDEDDPGLVAALQDEMHIGGHREVDEKVVVDPVEPAVFADERRDHEEIDDATSKISGHVSGGIGERVGRHCRPLGF